MKKALPLVVLLMLSFSAFGQQQTQTPAATPNPENDVVKISTKLVQFDLLVVDKDGKQVRDLTADDFEVLQDGKPQKITNFSYINTETKPVPKSGEKKGTFGPPVRIQPDDAKRIITFIVDDGNCAASSSGIRASREGIEKFIREQMQPNDLVAIYQTRSGSSMLQQYTNDKAQLFKIAHKIQWYPPFGACLSFNDGDGSMFAAARSNTFIKQSPGGTSTKTIESDPDRAAREHYEDIARDDRIVGALGVVRYVVQGLRRVPGRKVVFMLSDGIPLRGRNGELLSSADVLRDLTDLANRSSVVFNTIDSRGLFDENMIEARDQVYAQDDVLATDKIRNDRISEVINTRDGMAFLARETGGKFYQSQNYLDAPIQQALETETGYYLIAYDPADEAFKSKKFNKVKVKVKRPDLKVVSRSGFVGVEDEDTKRKYKTADSELYEAISAPLPRPGLNLQLTAFYTKSLEAGNVVRSFIHLQGDQITFVDEADGYKKAVFDVVAVTLDGKNRVVDEFTRTHTYKVNAAAIPAIIKNGLIYSTDVAIKKAGTYNFRVAVRDVTNRQIGSSSQILEIPDLKKTHLFVSGLLLAQTDANGKFSIPGAVKPENALTLTTTAAVPAIRQFRRGAILAYFYNLYNPRLDPATGQPKLSIQTKVYRNGQVVINGTPQIAQLEKQLDWTNISDYSYLRLAPQMEAGDYALQIIVTDLLDSGKSAISSQWVDFVVTE